jgi:hypothetical protein
MAPRQSGNLNAETAARLIEMLRNGFGYCEGSCNFVYHHTNINVIELVQHFRQRHSLSVDAKLEAELLHGVEKGRSWFDFNQVSGEFLDQARQTIEALQRKPMITYLTLNRAINVLSSAGHWCVSDEDHEKWLGEKLQLQIEADDCTTTKCSLNAFGAPFRLEDAPGMPFDRVDCVDNVFIVKQGTDSRSCQLTPIFHLSRFMNVTEGMLSMMRKQDEAFATLSQPVTQPVSTTSPSASSEAYQISGSAREQLQGSQVTVDVEIGTEELSDVTKGLDFEVLRAIAKVIEEHCERMRKRKRGKTDGQLDRGTIESVV